MMNKEQIASELRQASIKGRDAVIMFHNFQVQNFKGVYKFKTPDELIAVLSARPMQKNFLAILGGGISGSEIANSQVTRAMEKLSEASQGRIPADNAAFLGAIQEKATEFSYVDAIGYAAIETAKAAGDGAVKVGNAVLSITDTLLESSKVLVPVALIFLAYAYTKKAAA